MPPMIRSLPFLKPSQGFPLCLEENAISFLWPSRTSLLLSTSIQGSSQFLQFAESFPLQRLCTFSSLPHKLTQILTWLVPSHPALTPPPLRGHPCLPTVKALPTLSYLPLRSSSQFLSWLEIMYFAYSFTCLLSASPVITCQVGSFMSRNLAYPFSSCNSRAWNSVCRLLWRIWQTSSKIHLKNANVSVKHLLNKIIVVMGAIMFKSTIPGSLHKAAHVTSRWLHFTMAPWNGRYYSTLQTKNWGSKS